MTLIPRLKSEAIQRGLLEPAAEIDPATAFTLVRDMTYHRASDRRPETIIAEWQGTCSGKHYLLQALFAELGLPSQVIACTSVLPIEPHGITPDVFPLYEAANRRFVDVHNYLVLTLDGDRSMIVDATWPLSTRPSGKVVNEQFILGENQQIAQSPIESWPVPAGQDPQAFKDQLLKEHFTTAELEFRELIIQWLSQA